MSRTLFPSIVVFVACLLVMPCAADDEFPKVYNTQKIGVPLPTPDAALKMISVPKGFRVTLFAGEPDVRQPIAATTDARGRLWVAENNTYAERERGFDTELHDRIIILDDVDHDGRFDKRTVFWDKGVRLTSVEIGFGGVWALCAPHLLFIPDRNGDDVPDGPPQIVLDGWKADSIRHNLVNGLRWGPDGWLYGCHGILETSLVGIPGSAASKRKGINCGIWRYHPTRKEFEVVAHGGTNPWGFDYDENGEMFMINTVIGHLWHVVPGARYRRMYGTHFNPHTYDVIEQTADHFHWDVKGEVWNEIRKLGVTDATDRAGGGHAHCGLMIYQGENWPRKYRNSVFTVNLHGQRLNRDRIERQGNGYTARHRPDFMQSKDPWFRGVQLIQGRDGGVFVLDWSDIGECHENDGVHRTSGRIYKITYGVPRPPKHADLSKLSDLDLAKLQVSHNEWEVRTARRLLHERAVSGSSIAEAIEWMARPLERYERPYHVHERLRYLWCMATVGALNEKMLMEQFKYGDERVRAWAVRMLIDLHGPPRRDVVDRLIDQANVDQSGLVRLYLASALNELDYRDRFAVARGLVSFQQDAADRTQPLLIWYGIEPAVVENPDLAVWLISQSKIPLIRQYIARRLTGEIEESPQSVAKLVALLESSSDSILRQDVLTGMAAALRGWRKAPQPAKWESVAAGLSKNGSETINNQVRELGVVFGNGRALDEVRRIARDTTADTSSRRQAIHTLAENRPDDLFVILKGLIGDRELQHDVVRALAACDDPSIPALILNQIHRLTPEGQSDAVDTLSSRPEWALAMLTAVEKGRLPGNSVTAWHARQIQSFGNDQVTKRLAKVWGEIRETSAERKQQIETLRTQLSGKTLKQPSLSHGRMLFSKTCAACHTLYGTGGNNGPDLTGANRKNLNYLLENIVDPSASVAANFRVSVIALDSGRIITGVVVAKTERTLTVQTQKERLTIDRSDVAEINETKKSLMPDGVLKQLSETDIRDLFGYLMSKSQVPLPAESAAR